MVLRYYEVLILFSTIIPVSLRVNLDLGKSVYSYQIEKDLDIQGTISKNIYYPRRFEEKFLTYYQIKQVPLHKMSRNENATFG